MSNKYVIYGDSCADLSIEQIKEYDLNIIPLIYDINDKTYFDYPDQREMSSKDFYDLLRQGKRAFTTMITMDRYLEVFEAELKKGNDIIYLAFSSALSSSYVQALQAKTELEKKYVNNKIIVVDSLSASMGEGLLLYYASKLKKEGKSIEEVEKWLIDNRLNLIHLFTIQSLMHLNRGGRLSYTKALVGSVLRLKPVLHVSDEGKLVPISNFRGRRKALEEMINLMENNIVNKEEQVVFISHGDDYDEALEVKKAILEKYKVKDVIINNIGPVIGAHSGADTIAVFFLGKAR